MPTKLEANASFRKPRLVFLVLALALIFSVVCVGGVSGHDTWDTTIDTSWYYSSPSNDVTYTITTAEQLAGLEYLVNEEDVTFDGDTINLETDIDLSNHDWTPIGYSNSFAGTFDGQYHTISNYCPTTKDRVCGLFGSVSGIIQNLVVSDITIEVPPGKAYSGAIIGQLKSGGYVINCVVIGLNTGTGSSSGSHGGMIGYMDSKDSKYLYGWSVDRTTIYSPKSGIVVGNWPELGSEDGNVDSPIKSRIQYKTIVYTHKMTGLYPNMNEYTEITELTLYAEIGSVVRPLYTIDDGYYVNKDESDLEETPLSEGGTTTFEIHIYKTGYLITIPASVHIPEASNPETDPEAVMLMDVQYLWIPEGSSVSVTVNSQNDFHLKYSINPQINPLKYLLHVEDGADNRILSNVNNVVKEFSHDDDAYSDVSLTITVEDEPHYSGVYTDLLTFTSSYIEPMQVT